jgi:hypothetical protein
LVDLFLSIFLWNFFIVRFHVLWISTPFRLLSERSNRLKSQKAGVNTGKPLRLPEPQQHQWVAGAMPSVSEHTTEHLQEYIAPSPRSLDDN